MASLSLREATRAWLDELAHDWARYINPDEDREYGLELEERSGLWRLLASFFPLVSPDGCIEVQFVSCQFPSRMDGSPAVCRRRGWSFGRSVRVVFRVVVFEPGDGDENRLIYTVMEQEVYLFELPVLTEEGTFVVDGQDMVCVPEFCAHVDEKRERVVSDAGGVRLMTPGALLMAHLEDGMHRVVRTTLGRLAKIEDHRQVPMPHNLFSFRPLHTRLRRWVRATMEPFGPANPAAALAHLLKVRRPGRKRSKPSFSMLPLGAGIAADGTLLVERQPQTLPQWLVEAEPLLDADVPPACGVVDAQGSVWSPCDGVVASVEDGVLVVSRPLLGEFGSLCWPEAVPFFSGSGALKHVPRVLVEVGQEVSAGQPLASGYLTAGLACGRDIKAAFVPVEVLARWLPEAAEGVYLNPDSDVAQRFASSHIHTIRYELKKADRPEGAAFIGADLLPGEVKDLDGYGVVVEGSQVDVGDVLVSMPDGAHLRVPEGQGPAEVVSAWFFSVDSRRTQTCERSMRDLERFDEGTRALMKAAGGALRSLFKSQLVGGQLLSSMGYDSRLEGWVTLPMGTPVTEALVDGLPFGALVDLAACACADHDLVDRLYRLMDEYNAFVDSRFFERERWARTVSLPRNVLQTGVINLQSTRALMPGDGLLSAQGQRAALNAVVDDAGLRAFCDAVGGQPEVIWAVKRVPQWVGAAQGFEAVEAMTSHGPLKASVGHLYAVKTRP